jgi:hypothetical protein
MSRFRRLIPSRAMAVAVIALAFSMTGTAVAVNPSLILNQGNTATGPTTVTAASTWSTTGSQRLLQLTNNTTTTGATALGLAVATGHPPFAVNSATKVANLNADKLDNLDSTQLQRRITGSCPNGTAISSVAAQGLTGCSGPVLRKQVVGALGGFGKDANRGSFTTGGGPLLITFDATGYSLTANALIGAYLIACPGTPCAGGDTPGEQILTSAETFTNEATSHRTMAASSNLIQLPAGTYYLNVIPFDSTATDGSDNANWTIIEFGNPAE